MVKTEDSLFDEIIETRIAPEFGGHEWKDSDSGVRRFINPGENAMCEIGKPVETIEVEPLSLPAPLRKQPAEQPVTVEVPVLVSKTTVEPATITIEKL